MRIRYAFDEFIPSTATDTEQVMNTVAALGRRGVDVELVVPEGRGGQRVPVDELTRHYAVEGPFGLRYVPVRFGGARPLHKAAHAAVAARLPGAFDCLYTRNLSALAAGLAAGHRVAYEHFRPWPDQYPPLEGPLRGLLRHPRCLGAVLHSHHSAASYRRIGVPEERLLVAHNGYDPRRMEPEISTQEARRRLGMGVQGPLVVYTGHVNPRKGLDVVLEMARRAPDITFLLVGSEGEGPIEREASRIPNVRIVPWQAPDRTALHLFAADVLLVPPSLVPLERHGNTVLPMKLFLYLAARRAILGPRAPDTAELLRDGENAALVEPGDVSDASRRLRELFDDPGLRERLADGARRSARGLTWDARAEKIERFLEARLRDGVPVGPDESSWTVGGWAVRTGRWALGR